jgi:hypothetical protein
MKPKWWWTGLCGGLAGSALLAGAVALAQLPQAPAEPVAEPAAQKAEDKRKREIEVPTEKLVARTAEPSSDNPKVQPGKVNWHPDLEAACQAAKQSGKPVLVFHMMGRLDDRFC